jgi:hypothetical protein
VRKQARARHAARYTEVELRPLDAGGTRSMLNHLFRQEDLPRSTRRLIEEKARGNPLYIEEVIRALVDEGAVEHVDGRFRATDKIGSVAIPGSIHELVMARVDGLDPAKRQLLQTASVIGGTFSVEVLAKVVENVARLPEDVAELVDAEFLARSERAPAHEYAFQTPADPGGDLRGPPADAPPSAPSSGRRSDGGGVPRGDARLRRHAGLPLRQGRRGRPRRDVPLPGRRRGGACGRSQ